MKIQLAEKRIIQDPEIQTVWTEHGPGVDLVMDAKALTYAPGSVDAIFAFHVLDHLFPEEVVPALANWRKCLKRKGGTLFIVVDNFEYIARGFVGGDVAIEDFNKEFAHPTQFTQFNLVSALKLAGFRDEKTVIWSGNIENIYSPRPFELVMSIDTDA